MWSAVSSLAAHLRFTFAERLHSDGTELSLQRLKESMVAFCDFLINNDVVPCRF